MLGRSLLAISAASLTAGCGDEGTTTITCGEGTSGALVVGGSVTVTRGADLNGATITAGPKTTVPSGDVSIQCADDIVPSGFVALGPAVSFGTEGTWSDRPFELTLPYKAARLPAGAGRRHVRVIALRPGQTEPFFPLVANRLIDDDDKFASRVSFRAGELTTYQVVASEDAGQPKVEQFGWNATVGISMGGNAAMSLAMRHPDRFDSVADLGGEPGPSMRYTLSMVRKYTFGGFCDADDEAAGRGNIGQLCPRTTTRPDQFEIESDFEHMLFQDGDGVGLTLQRSLYMRGIRDMSRAMSNPAFYNPANPYAPPGVDFSTMATDPATRCPTAGGPAVPNAVTLTSFFDREFNPDGSKPVITFCDGGDTREGLGLGVFDPSKPHMDPAELLLAVDLNGNGVRDSGEPVITNAFEPFQDVGVDALADVDEPGYDAVTNPDPNHDNFHWQRNPRGTENNEDFDVGEPFDDFGLDGVAGTCQSGSATDCYDFGEGDGTWTLSPNVARWYEHDAITRFSALDQTQRDHMRLWFDAGIRDFLNNSVSVNMAAGQLSGVFGMPFGMYDGFGPLVGDGGSENTYDFTTVPWQDVPRHGYMRYGNPDASDTDIERGDGRHVGTAVQIINRATTAFAWLDKQWPDGDRSDTLDGGTLIKDLTLVSPTTGRDSPYGLFLPPGYDALPDQRFPVVYFFHGYGQEPQDLVDLSAVFANYMIAEQPLEYRFQKFIIVYVDGRCRPQRDGVPVDPSGDLCEGGTFYTDAPMGGTARMEQNLLDLMAHIDATYRTKTASSVEVVP